MKSRGIVIALAFSWRGAKHRRNAGQHTQTQLLPTPTTLSEAAVLRASRSLPPRPAPTTLDSGTVRAGPAHSSFRSVGPSPATAAPMTATTTRNSSSISPGGNFLSTSSTFPVNRRHMQFEIRMPHFTAFSSSANERNHCDGSPHQLRTAAEQNRRNQHRTHRRRLSRVASDCALLTLDSVQYGKLGGISGESALVVITYHSGGTATWR